MTFKSWLLIEKTSQIQFTSFSADGRVVVYIDGVRYSYITDSIYHNRWKKLSRFQPGKVLNEIKKLVDVGQAEYLGKDNGV